MHGFVESKETPFVYVNRLSKHLQQNHLLISHPHKHDFFLTVIFTAGSGKHEIDFRSYPVTPGSVFFLLPGQSHHWDLSDDTDGFILFHTHSVGRHATTFPFHSYMNPNPLLQLAKDDAEAIQTDFMKLFAEYEGGAMYREWKLQNLIENLYIELARRYTDNPGKQIPASGEYIRKFELLLEAQYMQDKHPSFYASQLFISPRHLNRLTQEHYGKTPGALIARRVVLEAKRMLVHGTGSLAFIAETLGFDDYAYFSRYFKRVEGVSPSEFVGGMRGER